MTDSGGLEGPRKWVPGVDTLCQARGPPGDGVLRKGPEDTSSTEI